VWGCGSGGGRDCSSRRSGGRDWAFHDLSPAGGQQDRQEAEGDQADGRKKVFAHAWVWYLGWVGCQEVPRLCKGHCWVIIGLLTGMDVLHPDVLLQHAIQPADYKSGLVFRSAIESIRGTFIASSTTGREGLVRDVLENLLQRNCIADYAQSGSRARHDFTVSIERDPDYFGALEVKGGEGNSINISERPLWAREFGVWCHLDGAIVNQPAHGAHSIINCTDQRTGQATQVGRRLILQGPIVRHAHAALSQVSRTRGQDWT